MTYRIAHGTGLYGLDGLGGLGNAEEQARARRLNEESGAADTRVGPGFFNDWLDAALTVRGVSGTAAGRVPGAVREMLEASGAEVDKVCWGGRAGGGCGGEATAGKVYIKWKPGRPYNAVTYADIIRRLVALAAEPFAAGSRLILHRYRIMYGWIRFGSDSRDKYVYPEGGAIPAGAPEAAHRTPPDAVPLEPPPFDIAISEAAMGGDNTASIALLVGGGAAAMALLGGGWWFYSKRMKRNRRRRRRRRRTSR
jgi:hypothetical protein